jgi:2-hydroxy-6-oxonona-2,4-dienedioate hydrolase
VKPIDSPDTSRFVQTKTWRIHYHEIGNGPPIVLLHNTGPGSTGWNNFRLSIEAFADQGRVLAVDLPGWGQSDQADRSTGRDHVGALGEFLDALELSKAALIGNSRGGRVALTFAATHPERVTHLVTVGSSTPGPNIFSTGSRSEASAALGDAYRSPSVATFDRLLTTMIFNPDIARAETDRFLKSALEVPSHLSNWLAFSDTGEGGVGGGEGLLTQLAALPCPTLVFHGRNDRSIHFENALRLSSTVPNSTLVLFNKCGHWLQFDRASEFTQMVINFLSDVPGA